jgi:hypothetical protein
MYSLLRFLSFLILVNFLTLGCDDENPNPNYPLYPIDLKVTELPNGWRYEWNKINARDFDSYWVVRTEGDTVPYLADNDIKLIDGKTEIVKVSTIVDSTVFYDTTSIVNKNAHVRVFAFLGNRTLSSINKAVKANSNLASMSINASDFIFDNINKKLIGIDRNKSLISIFNIENNREILNKPPENNTFNPFLSLAFNASGEIYYANTSFGNELFIPTVSRNFIIFNIDNGSFKNSTTFSSESSFFAYKQYILTGNQNFITKITRDITNTLFNNESISQSFVFSNSSFFLRAIPNKKEIWGFKDITNDVEIHRIDYTKLDNTSGSTILVPFDSKVFKFPFKITAKPFVFSKNGEKFITTTEGIITDINNQNPINLSKKLPGKTFLYLNFLFSEDGLLIYGLRNNTNNTSENKVDVFKYPEGDFIKSISFKIKADEFFLDKNELILAGRASTTLEKSFIERIKL